MLIYIVLVSVFQNLTHFSYGLPPNINEVCDHRFFKIMKQVIQKIKINCLQYKFEEILSSRTFSCEPP